MNPDMLLPGFAPDAFVHPASASVRLHIAVSACLTGAPVRYDGGHKHLDAIDRWLQPQADLLPLCPEVEAGLGTPRPPVQLVRIDGKARALGRDDAALDVTAALKRTATATAPRLLQQRISGCLWKSRSPSCGLGSTPLFDGCGNETGSGSGLHTAHLQRALPWLAMAEEVELMTADGAWRFLLLCRLVHDARYMGETTAAVLARRHEPLLAALPSASRQRIGKNVEKGLDFYLAGLLPACGALTTARLRSLFAAG
jgi:uncharacterized protein YbbK (DUF523 family)